MRIRQHVNPLLSFFNEFRGVAPTLTEGRPVDVEIGCADAQFLFELADKNPNRTYVGLEIRDELVDFVNKRAATLSVPVTAVFCQAQKHLGEIFPPDSVSRVYINFPDPWFKRRHVNRRMVDEVLVAGISEIVKPGADVLVQSDVWDVALDAMEAFENNEDFVNLAGEWSFWRQGNPYGVRSWREQNAEETGLPIWRIRYQRR
jgi:tRNA (guanine-N7-)-methyltransferase